MYSVLSPEMKGSVSILLFSYTIELRVYFYTYLLIEIWTI